MNRILIGCCLLFFLALASCGNKTQVDDNPYRLMEQTSKNDIEMRLMELSEQLRTDTLNHNLFFQRALLYHMAGQYEYAYIDLKYATSLDSTRASYYSLLGEVFFGLKSSSGAISAFERSVELDSTQIEPRLRLGEAYLFMGDRSNSFKHLNAALRIDRYNPKAFFLRGMNHKEMGDTSLAITNFNAAAELEPEYYDAYMQLGLIFSNRKDNRAIAFLNQALRSDPSSLEALYARAMYLQEIDSFQLAAIDYEVILEVAPTYRNVSYNLGFVNYMMGNYELAIDHFTRAIAQDPRRVHAYYGRGLSYKEVNKKRDARADLLKVQEMDPFFEGIDEDIRSL